MQRVHTIPVNGALESRVVVTLTDGEQLEASVNRAHGNPADPLTDAERLEKFHECAATSASEAQRERIIDLCARLDSLADVRELAAALGEAPHGL
jgi:2-methylcitrate dehydratase PrpD